jgi:hypothetical protein
MEDEYIPGIDEDHPYWDDCPNLITYDANLKKSYQLGNLKLDHNILIEINSFEGEYFRVEFFVLG